LREPVAFFVPGVAKPAGSKKAFCLKRGGNFTGRAVVTDACKGSKSWKANVRHYATKHLASLPSFEVFNTPVKFEAVFILQRPKGHLNTKGGLNAQGSAKPFPTVKPDVLKLARAVEDALTGTVYQDDALIVTETLKKRYGSSPGVAIRISEEVEG
jgi:Holliday junction resolvase RusA-like endonuclease